MDSSTDTVFSASVAKGTNSIFDPFDSTSKCEVGIFREIEYYQNVYGNESAQREGIVGFKEIMEAPIEGVTIGRLEIIAGTLVDKNEDGDESRNNVAVDIYIFF